MDVVTVCIAGAIDMLRIAGDVIVVLSLAAAVVWVSGMIVITTAYGILAAGEWIGENLQSIHTRVCILRKKLHKRREFPRACTVKQLRR